MFSTIAWGLIQQYFLGRLQPLYFGYGLAVVQSGSMEPAIPTGSLIIVHQQDSYEEGDVVMYAHENGLSVTHRIIDMEDGQIHTRGDANSVADPWFSEDKIIGKIILMGPKVKDAVDVMKNPVTIAALCGLFAGICTADILKSQKQKAKAKSGLKVKIENDEDRYVFPAKTGPTIADKYVKNYNRKNGKSS